MNFRTFFVLIVSVLFFSGAHAQDVSYSEYEKYDFRSGDFAVVGKIGGRFYTYRSNEGNYFLDAYNDSMQRTATVMLDFFPAKVNDVKFIAMQDKIIAVYEGVEGVKVTLYAALMDVTGRLKKGPIVLDNAKASIFGTARKYFSVAVSDDKKTFVVYSISTKGSEIIFDGKVLDDELSVPRKLRGSFKTDQDVTHGDVSISNAGKVYMPVFTPIGSKYYSDRVWLMTLSLNNNASRTVSVADMPLQDRFAGNMYMKVDNLNNKIYMGGFYAGKKNGSYQGIIYAYYNIGDSSMHDQLIPFDEKLLNETGQRNKKRAFDDFQVRQLIVKNDGGFVMVSEDYSVTTRNNYTPGFGYYSWYYNPYMANMVTEYRFNDVMVLSYNADGVRQWDDFVYKEQYSIEDRGLFSSYLLLNTGGVLGFLYNDFNTSRSKVQLATVDAEGKKEDHSFSIEGNDYPDWLPRFGKQVSGREIIVPCLHKKQICFAKVVF